MNPKKNILGLKSQDLYKVCNEEKPVKECEMPLKSILKILEREK